MKLTDCTWEIANLGVKTCEIEFDENEIVDFNQVKDLEQQYSYIVCKVSSNSYDKYNELTSLGFVFNEAQLSIIKTFASYDLSNRVTANFMRKLSLRECVNEEELIDIVDKIHDVYETDRIAINPAFGCVIANKRYGNWITAEWKAKRSRLFEVIKGNQSVGFCLFKEHDYVVEYLLGGLYSEYKNTGIGLCLPLLPYLFQLYVSDGKNNLSMVETKISTNNLAVLQCYMHYCYQVQGVEYVFTKNL